MDRVSSQLTIFIRIALPTIWFTTILSLFVLLIWSVQGKAQIFANPIIWISMLGIIGMTYIFMKFILWRFYRVDMDERFVYVSNYFKTYKYPFSDIEYIKTSSVLPGRVFNIRLKSKGTFGQKIAFLASQKLWSDFVIEHPHLFESIYRTDNKS